MTKRSHIVRVALGERTYPIIVGADVNTAAEHFKRLGISRSLVIITDQHVARHYLSGLKKLLEKKGYAVRSIVLPPGENQKSLNAVAGIFTRMLEWNIERSSAVVAFGGGVIGDCAGFVAATYQRGIGFVQIPTTLLAQVDSSVGGKVGVNHPLAKNMIGAFYQPQLVIADPNVLRTLPKRELICGLGEVVKYGVILDKKFFADVEKNLEQALTADRRVLSRFIKRSCELKAFVVAKDEKEQHLRAILNFGHTVGHALEHAGKYGALKHGEAILYGMVAETHIAYRKGMISLKEKERLESLIQRIPLPSLSPLRLRADELLATMRKDKKTKNGTIRMSLPLKIGKVTLPMEVSDDLIRDAVEYVKIYGL